MQVRNRTRQWIASGYLELADCMPLRKITVQKICEHTQINRSTFYYHFNSTQDLIHWIYHEEVNEPILEKIRREPEHLQEISIIALSNIYKKRDFWKKVLQLNTAGEFEDFMLRDTRENWKEVVRVILADKGLCMEKLEEEQRFEMEYITEYYCAAHYHVTLLWMKQGMKVTPEKLAETIDNIAINGFFSGINEVTGNS